MPILPYDYLHLVNCPEVVTISDNYCIQTGEITPHNRAFHVLVDWVDLDWGVPPAGGLLMGTWVPEYEDTAVDMGVGKQGPDALLPKQDGGTSQI